MSPEEFKAQYCANSGLSEAEFDMYFVVLPCACGADGCNGFAAVDRNERSIKAHMELYAPKPTDDRQLGNDCVIQYT